MRRVSDRTYYDVIGAAPQAAKADLKAAYVGALDAAQAAGDTDEAAQVRRAWQVLSDPVQRQRYDEEIGLGGRGGRERRSGDGADEAGGDDAGGELDEEALDVEVVDELAPGPRPQSILPGVPDFLEQPTIGRRLTASIIDVVTLVAVFAASFGIAFALIGSDGGRVVALIVLIEAWIVGLFVVPTLRTGQTLGKRFTYVMTVDRATGNLPSAGQVIRRYVIPMVAIPALGQLGPFLALFFGLSYAMGRDQLSLADRLASTVVVVARYRPARSGTPA